MKQQSPSEDIYLCSRRDVICLIDNNSGTQLRRCIHGRQFCSYNEVIRKMHFRKELFWIQISLTIIACLGIVNKYLKNFWAMIGHDLHASCSGKVLIPCGLIACPNVKAIFLEVGIETLNQFYVCFLFGTWGVFCVCVLFSKLTLYRGKKRVQGEIKSARCDLN